MKTSLLIASAVVFSMAFAKAQSNKIVRTGYDSSWYTTYPTKEMVKVKSTEVPSSLKTTLKASEYKGWEAGTIYQNPMTHEYALQLTQPTNTASGMINGGWFRFDQQGKRIPDPKKE